MTSWDDYWKTFDLLVEKLKRGGQEQVINELRDAQKYVNGMTDGWFEFKTEMEKSLELHKTKMTADQVVMLNELIETLTNTLTRRG